MAKGHVLFLDLHPSWAIQVQCYHNDTLHQERSTGTHTPVAEACTPMTTDDSGNIDYYNP